MKRRPVEILILFHTLAAQAQRILQPKCFKSKERSDGALRFGCHEEPFRVSSLQKCYFESTRMQSRRHCTRVRITQHDGRAFINTQNKEATTLHSQSEKRIYYDCPKTVMVLFYSGKIIVVMIIFI